MKSALAFYGKRCYNRFRDLAFASSWYIVPPVAKLDIAADSDSEGRGFESLRAGQKKSVNLVLGLFFRSRDSNPKRATSVKQNIRFRKTVLAHK